jgi:hypothetical protein
MATNFPANPSNGDTFAGYTYDSNLGAWKTTTSRIDNYLEVANSTGFASSTDLDAYLQVANSTSFATTSQLDGYLQVANSTGFASSTDLDAYLQVANSTGFASSTDLDAYLQVANLSNITSSLIPSANVTYDLGSTTNYWKDLYLSGNTIFLGSSQITLNANGGIDLPAGSRMGGTLIGSGSGGGASVTIADTAPGSPSAGDLWWSANTSELFIYYTDTDTSQWVQATTPGATGPAGADGSSVTSYASTSAFPTSGNSVGDFAFATDTKAVYIWDGSEWDRISAGVDESPIILTEPATTLSLSDIGANSTLTMVATDPEGFDITYGIAYKNTGSILPDQLASAPVIDQANGVYTFTPSTDANNAGTFTARLSASDGVKTTTRFCTISLGFSEDIIWTSAEPGVSTTLTNTTTGWNSGGITASSGMAQSNNLRLGKRYFELYMTGGSGGYFFGFYDETNTNPGYNDTDGPALYYNGNVYPTANFVNWGLGAIYASYPRTLMFAYDTTARLCWFGMDGTWGTGAGDPITGAGYTIGGTGALTFCLGSGSGASTVTGNILLGANLTYGLPTGYSSH